MTHDVYTLPPNLPVPQDDGAADHLLGLELPDLVLESSLGPVNVHDVDVLYVYPRTGRPDRPLLPGWDETPGARGCTPQSCAFRDAHGELQALGVRVAGLSAQPLEEQQEFAERNRIPFPVNRAVLLRGQERFNVYCSPCHGRLGNGLGMIVRRGLKRPPSYHIDRLRQVPVGYFYDVITNGFGAMPDYAMQIAPRDRWSVAAYIRVLQYSQDDSINDVPAEMRAELPSPNAPAAQGPKQ